MKRIAVVLSAALLSVCLLAQQTTAVKPPVAKKVPKSSTIHGDTRVDDYAWIRDKKNPEVIAYLQAENAYADAVMAPDESFRNKLYDEMLGRIKQTDVNVPYRNGAWFYNSRTEQGKQYPIFVRQKSLDAPEEVVLDLNKLAEGQKFMALGAFEPSDDGSLLAYTTDNTGYRQYTLHVKDLRTGEVLPDTAPRVNDLMWAKDNKTLLYTQEHEVTKRPYLLYRHVLGATNPDPVVYEEKDELYNLGADRSRSGDWIFVGSDSKTTSEQRIIPAADPAAEPRVVAPRKTDHKYSMEHRGDRFYIMTNDTGINYRVVSAPVSDPQQKNWTEVVAYRKPVKIDAIDAFADHLVLRVREGGLAQIEVVDFADGKTTRVAFPEPTYALFNGQNRDFNTTKYRYVYQSLVTPSSTYDYDMSARTSSLLKRTEVLGGFDPANYRSERIWATAKDGARVPISIVYRKSVNPHGVNPLWLTAYGSYGISSQATFNSSRLSMLDRGVVFAIAHIRGGGEMGKEWHEQGRMMTKKNTFTDFVAAAEHLVNEKYTSKEKLVISGGSAGGLLMGAVTNMRPDLFKAVVAYVPFVDVINTMLDPTLPLTTQEYIEWGNPNEKPAYVYMKSYDPYSNVSKKRYPSMLVRTSLNDSQVGYWEGTKWVAKLRANKTGDNPLLLKVNMGAGHGGSSGRYDKLHEDAWDYAFMLEQLGTTR
ncbi:MAG TPA: S9 family peptidase [Thermoanaerobaculia bacterium]|nr:S9 family peptidase [Thermoanaerobaculia bacterium]